MSCIKPLQRHCLGIIIRRWLDMIAIKQIHIEIKCNMACSLWRLNLLFLSGLYLMHNFRMTNMFSWMYWSASFVDIMVVRHHHVQTSVLVTPIYFFQQTSKSPKCLQDSRFSSIFKILKWSSWEFLFGIVISKTSYKAHVLLSNAKLIKVIHNCAQSLISYINLLAMMVGGTSRVSGAFDWKWLFNCVWYHISPPIRCMDSYM